MKIRIDELLVLQKIAPTRSKAKHLIADGLIFYKDKKVEKPGQRVPDDAKIEVTPSIQYVGRGAKKLEGALKSFNIQLKGKIIADIGASTGGFTDCALQNGAIKVYAIDVGHSQLAEKLINDPRVINLEKNNIRDNPQIPEQVDYAVVDLSYISLTLTLKNIAALLQPQGKIIALLKPQFEAGPGIVGRDGVIKDPEAIKTIIKNFRKWCDENGFKIEKFITSPITGKEGNKEFLTLITPSSQHLPMHS